MATKPFRIDKIGNVTDRATGQQLGFVVGGASDVAAVFSHIPALPDDTDPYADAAPAWRGYEAETGRPVYAAWGFRTRADAAQFLWATREWPRESFPPAPLGPRRTETGWQWPRDVAAAWETAAGLLPPYFVGVRVAGERRWAAYGRVADLPPGATAKVRRRGGEVVEVELEEEILSTETLFGVEVVEVLVKPRKSAPRRTNRTRRFVRECPRCGEDFDGMWNGHRCLECGYQR